MARQFPSPHRWSRADLDLVFDPAPRRGFPGRSRGSEGSAVGYRGRGGGPGRQVPAACATSSSGPSERAMRCRPSARAGLAAAGGWGRILDGPSSAGEMDAAAAVRKRSSSRRRRCRARQAGLLCKRWSGDGRLIGPSQPEIKRSPTPDHGGHASCRPTRLTAHALVPGSGKAATMRCPSSPRSAANLCHLQARFSHQFTHPARARAALLRGARKVRSGGCRLLTLLACTRRQADAGEIGRQIRLAGARTAAPAILIDDMLDPGSTAHP